MSGLHLSAGPETGKRLGRTLVAERALLLEYLRALPEGEWAGPTLCSEWDVRQVAVHLLGTDEDALSLRNGIRLRAAAKKGPAAAMAHFEARNRAQQSRHAGAVPPALLEALERAGAKLGRRLERLPGFVWNSRISFGGTPMPMADVMRGLLVNAWVHRRDIQEPRGVARDDDREQLALLVPFVFAGVFGLAGYRAEDTINLDLGWAGPWRVEPGTASFLPGHAPRAAATVRLEPGALVLLATGRRASAAAAGAGVEGDAAAAERFAKGIRYLGESPGF